MKHCNFYTISVVLALSLVLSVSAWGETWILNGKSYESTLKTETTVAEGVQHKLFVLSGPSNLEVQVVEVDMTAKGVDITTNKARANERVNDDPYAFKTVGAQAEEVKARGVKPVMGMNADFFLSTGNLSHQMAGGVFTRFGNLTQKKDRPRWYMTERRTFGLSQYTVRPSMTIYRDGAAEGEEVKEPNTLYNIISVNSSVSAPTMQIFTPAKGRTTGTQMKEVYADLVEGYLGLDGVAKFKVLDVCTDEAHLNNEGRTEGNSALDNHYVIAGTKEFGNSVLEGLKPGDIVEFAFPAKDNFNETGVADADLKELIGGSLKLLVDGKVQNLTNKDADLPAQTNFSDGNPGGLEPRAGIGYTNDNTRFYMVIVDGRRAGVAEGCTMSVFADIMLNIGAENALNLDGGGSATLYNAISGEVCNWPTDGMKWQEGVKGQMRSVPNSIWVVIDDNSGVEDVVVGGARDDEPVEYFNLQGMRIGGEAKGFVICRKGNRVSKLLLR